MMALYYSEVRNSGRSQFTTGHLMTVGNYKGPEKLLIISPQRYNCPRYLHSHVIAFQVLGNWLA